MSEKYEIKVRFQRCGSEKFGMSRRKRKIPKRKINENKGGMRKKS